MNDNTIIVLVAFAIVTCFGCIHDALMDTPADIAITITAQAPPSEVQAAATSSNAH
jgi:hypothetical protein